jgi:hypothetical protein
MKRPLILLIILVYISFQIQAQESRDTLFLKNGSIAFGKLMEVKDGWYKIKTTDGLLFTFPANEVEKFVLGSRSEPKELKITDPNGFGFGIESGLLLGTGNESFPFLLSFNPMLTYTFKNRHTTSFVSGVEIFDQFTLPFLLEYRYNILKNNVSPFIYIRGGGLVPLGGDDSNNSYKGGWTWGLGTGFRWPIGDFVSYIKFGFRYGYTVHTGEYYYYTESSPAEITYQAHFYRLEMKWGFKF